jgi:hypothetical protein
MLALLSCAGCSPSGRYLLEAVQYDLVPGPTVFYENVTDGSLQTLTAATGDYAEFADAPDAGATGSLERLVDGMLVELDLLGDEIVFSYGGESLIGGPSGDGWTVSHTSSGEQLVYIPYLAKDYWFAYLGAFDQQTQFTITLTGDRIHGEGTVAVGETSGWREVDEWGGFPAFGQILSGVYGPAGEILRNDPDVDDCDGDYCEVSATDYSETVSVTFDGARVGR